MEQIFKEGEREKEELLKSRKTFHRYLFLFFLAFLLGGVFWIGFSLGKSERVSKMEVFKLSNTEIENKLPLEKKEIDFSIFWKVWDLVKEKYVDGGKLDAQKMVYGAIRGMLKATGDPYTNFFDPEETKSFSQDLEGSFEGIGAELGIKDEILTVIAPLGGSPAEKAGLRAGDKIIKIDDRQTLDISIYESVDLIRGKRGTEVKLTILREGEEEAREISITRETIEVKSVELEFLEGNIAHLKINKFGEKTSREFDLAANNIIEKEAGGIVLDLRNNPGGFLDKCVEIASRMMPKDKTVVIEEGTSGKNETLYTQGGDKLSSFPTVVLINEGSASASEILAGALRDNLGVQLVGEKSFGKGSVQELINLPKESSVKITVAKWVMPNGEYIMEKGIIPNFEVSLSKEDYENNRDPQLDKALEILKEKIN